jgi:hypothetical protein
MTIKLGGRITFISYRRRLVIVDGAVLGYSRDGSTRVRGDRTAPSTPRAASTTSTAAAGWHKERVRRRAPQFETGFKLHLERV